MSMDGQTRMAQLGAMSMRLDHIATLMAHMALAGSSTGGALLIMQMRGTMHRQHVAHAVVE